MNERQKKAARDITNLGLAILAGRMTDSPEMQSQLSSLDDLAATEVCSDLVHQIRHFLADADIRHLDATYRDRQIKVLRSAIEAVDREL